MVALTEEQVATFREEGVLLAENFFSEEECKKVLKHVDLVNNHVLANGVEPDYNEPRGPRSFGVGNSWKGDPVIANFVFSEKLGEALGQLIGEGQGGVRMLRDSAYYRDPGSKATQYHQDSGYTTCYKEAPITNAFISLCNTGDEVGWMEYVKGSQHWAILPPEEGFDPSRKITPDTYRDIMYAAAEKEGVEVTEDMIKKVNAPMGAVIFHHGTIWHGASANQSETDGRVQLVCRATRGDVEWSEDFGGDHFSAWARRYKHYGEVVPDENFFPIIWREDGYRSPWLADYLGGKPF